MHIVMLRAAMVAFAPVSKGTVLDLPEEEARKVLDAGDARLRDDPEPAPEAPKVEGEPQPPNGTPGSGAAWGTGNTAGPPDGDGTGNTSGPPGTTGGTA